MSSGGTYFYNIYKRPNAIYKGSIPMGVPVGVQKWCRDVVLQLDNSKPQCAHGEHPGAINRAVPLELPSRGQAELVREVSTLVVVLSVLMFV